MVISCLASSSQFEQLLPKYLETILLKYSVTLNVLIDDGLARKFSAFLTWLNHCM